jgi:hypothetical protein
MDCMARVLLKLGQGLYYHVQSSSGTYSRILMRGMGKADSSPPFNVKIKKPEL